MDDENIFTDSSDTVNGQDVLDAADPVLDSFGDSASDPVDSVPDAVEVQGDINTDWYTDLHDCLIGIQSIDAKFSILSDGLLNKEQSELIEPSGVPDDPETVEADITEPEVTPIPDEEPFQDIYVQKLDKIIELQTAINDNVVKSQANMNSLLVLLLIIVCFCAGGIFVYSLFSKVRV